MSRVCTGCTWEDGGVPGVYALVYTLVGTMVGSSLPSLLGTMVGSSLPSLLGTSGCITHHGTLECITGIPPIPQGV